MTAARLAWGLFAAFIALWVAQIAFTVTGLASLDHLLALPVLGFGFAGALVASRLPGNAVGWLLLATGLALMLGALADANLSAEPAPALAVSAWLSSWTWNLGLAIATVFLPLLFPTGRLVSRRWRPVLWLAVVHAAGNTLGPAFQRGELEPHTVAGEMANPFGLPGVAGDVAVAMSDLADVVFVPAFVLAAVSLAVRFRRSRGIERQQIKWFAFAGLVAIAGLAVAVLASWLLEGDGLEVIAPIGWFTALAAVGIGIPAATGMAVLRHRLYDIDVVINRTVVYAVLTATLGATYLGSVLLLQLVLSPSSDLAVATSTLAVAAVFRPARARIQAGVDRRFYRRRYDARQTLEAFSARLRDEIELDTLSAELREVVTQTMQPVHASIWLRPPEEAR